MLTLILISSKNINQKLNLPQNETNLIATEIESKPTININNNIINLKKEYNNSEIVGAITMQNNNDFSYPIAQTGDNKYYLSHDYYQNQNAYGAIYADYRVNLDNSKKILIFGHSSYKGNMPFNELEKYEKKNYYDNHQNIIIETENATHTYTIFSVYIETNDFTYMNINFNSEESWYEHIKKLKQKSFYDTNIEIKPTDDILILQTCSNNKNYANYQKKYLLVVAKKIN